jgi:sec-independent protein translocase protein TatB
MFGVGLPELAVLALVAVFAFGPDRLPDFARQAGNLLRTVRRMSSHVLDEVKDGLGDEYADLELRDLNPRSLISREVSKLLVEDDTEDDVSRTETNR